MGFKGKVGNSFSNLCSSCLGEQIEHQQPLVGFVERWKIISAILSSRKGVISAAVASGKKEPVCEEDASEVETPYWDDISGKPLDPSGVKEARKEEVQVINEMGVWEVIPRPVGEKVISTRWVDINKGDQGSSQVPISICGQGTEKIRGSHRGDLGCDEEVSRHRR